MYRFTTDLKKFILLLLLALLCQFPSVAQTLPLVNYTVQNGLPQSTIYNIYQDHKGYLWLGTQNGACSFDGKQFRDYDWQLKFPNDVIGAIAGADDGRIFFGNWKGAISVLSNNTVTRLKIKGFTNKLRITAMLWRHNNLYVATTGNGLYAIDFSDTNKILVKNFIKPGDIYYNWINHIAVKNDHEIWLATAAGLRVFNTAKNLPVAFEQPPALNIILRCVYQGADNTLWCGSDSGVVYFEKGDLKALPKRITKHHGLISEQVNMIKVDHNGVMWLATSMGIAKITNGLVRCFSANNGLLNNYVYDLAEDREWSLWIGQYTGLSCYKDSEFEFYNMHDGLADNTVNAIVKDDNNNYWVGTNLGITVLNPDAQGSKVVQSFNEKNGLPNRYVDGLFKDSHKNIWVASRGAVCYLPSQKKFLNFNYKNGLAGIKVQVIDEDKKGRIWLATLDSGVAVYNYATNKMQTYKVANGFINDSVWTVHADNKGEMWFGTHGKGLVKLDSRTDKFIEVPGQEKLACRNFECLSSDSKGNIWIGTVGAGLYKYDGKRFTQYNEKQGIKFNSPVFVYCDKEDKVWLGTVTGMEQFDPKTLTIRYFEYNDGFLGVETSQNAIYPSGNDLWIGTINGLVHYQATKTTKNIPAPFVYITKQSLYFENKPLLTNILAHDQNYITFDYIGVSLSNGDKVRYSYFLQGLSKTWSPLSKESSVSYANLAPGSYTFMVKAGYQGGKWSAPVTYTFMISPPFYKTWWFIILSCAIIYFAGARLYSYRVDQLLKVEKMRSKIATDLHDDIGSALSSISIFSEVADKQLQQQAPREQTREIIAHISHNSRAMLDAMDDIVWAVNPKNDHLNDLAVRMREFAIPLLEASNIVFQINIHEGLMDTRVQMAARKNIFLVFKECINNVLKHAQSANVTVDLSKLNDQLQLRISDDGKGFDVNAPTNRNGIKNIQKRAAEINGSINIESQPGNGTVITLHFDIA